VTSPGKHTYGEIVSQPASWAEALRTGQAAAAQAQELWRESAASELLFTGCGSTYYLSLAAAALARARGLPARAAPASEIWLMPGAVSPSIERCLLVTVSRSGETTETVKALAAFRKAGGRGAALLTCYPESTLARHVDVAIAVPSAQEESVAQTRSFASMLVLTQLFIGALASDAGLAQRLQALPDLGKQLIADYGALASTLGADLSLERFFFLGNGPLYGLAEEAMLKMKEMTLSYSEGYHTLEFRHGPKSMVEAGTLAVGLISDGARAEEAAVLKEMRGLGARTLALADGGEAADSGDPSHLVRLGSGLPEAERLVLYLPILQLMAFHRSIAKGLDPDRPRNLTAAILL
jgi:glutamine---fructose-6-phosphate transaminase (isomerizing)